MQRLVTGNDINVAVGGRAIRDHTVGEPVEQPRNALGRRGQRAGDPNKKDVKILRTIR